MGVGGTGAAGDFPHPLGSRAKVLAKQEEAAAAAGKVGVAPLPPLAWGLRLPARTWERWSHLGGRGRGRPRQALVPAPGALLWLPWGTGKGDRGREGQPCGLCSPSWLPPVPFLFPYQWYNRKDRH